MLASPLPRDIMPKDITTFKLITVLHDQTSALLEYYDKTIWEEAEYYNDNIVEIELFEGKMKVGLQSLKLLQFYYNQDIFRSQRRLDKTGVAVLRKFHAERLTTLRADLMKIISAISEILCVDRSWYLIPEWFGNMIIGEGEFVVKNGIGCFWGCKGDPDDIVVKVFLKYIHPDHEQQVFVSTHIHEYETPSNGRFRFKSKPE